MNVPPFVFVPEMFECWKIRDGTKREKKGIWDLELGIAKGQRKVLTHLYHMEKPKAREIFRKMILENIKKHIEKFISKNAEKILFTNLL